MGHEMPMDFTERVRERFASRADDYRDSPVHASGPDLTMLLEWLDPQPAERALDVATGGGHVALALARTGVDVDACDLTPEMLDAARGLLSDNDCIAQFTVADAGALPYADETFDIVTCRIAAHHFGDPQTFFSEVARVLRPGGRFGFQDQALPPEGPSAVLTDFFERTRDSSHNQAYNEAGWKTLIERAELTVERSQLVDKRHDFAEWTARQGCDDATVAELTQQMGEAPEGMRRWLAPEHDGERLVAFINRHLVVLATKRP
ncbi:MAG: class I SAM-dependent methyltransferase [Coriobacteriia bacterium]